MLQRFGPAAYLAPRGQYGAYYSKSQFGHGVLPAYGGVARQRGHGIGSIIAGLLRGAVPLLGSIGRTAAKTAGTALLSTGAGVLSDVIAGKKVGKSVKARVKSSSQALLKRAHSSAQNYINRVSQPTPAKRRATARRVTRTKQQTGKGRKRKAQKRSNTLLF